MEVLSNDFILSGSEVEDLFNDESTNEEIQDNPPEQTDETNDETKKTTEDNNVNPEDLFNSPESVGSETEDNNKEIEDTNSKKDGTSPNNFYSSIASALKDEGILPDLDDDVVNNVKTPEDFAEAIEKQIQAKLDERQRRIDAALNADVEPEEIKQYETTLNFLSKINDDILKDESEKGENLRKRLIFQDFVNRGYSKERAQREVKKSFDSGTDIEDAKDALASNKAYFTEQYQNIIKEAQEEAKAEQDKIRKESENLRKSMLEDKEIWEGITLDKNTRQRAYENITKPIYKTEDGEYLTAIQKYQNDNPVEFRKYLAVLFTMTDGFKNIDTLVKGKVRKQVNQSIKDLENKISNTSRNGYGDPKYVSGVSDEESYFGKGWKVDI